MSFADFAETPLAALETLMERLPARQAEMKLVEADVISLPHMKASDRNATVNGWRRVLGQGREKVVRVASKGKLRLMGLGVR